MQVRALTGFLDPGWPLDTSAIQRVAEGLKQTSQALQDAGYTVQTLRLASPPPAEMSAPVPYTDLLDFARQLEAEAFIHGLDFAALGPILLDDVDGYDYLPEILAGTEIIFTSGLYADASSGVSLAAAHACAKTIRAISQISADGFGNLRFAGLVHVPAGTPFFPAAYHRGGPPWLAIATEAADLAVQAVKEGSSLRDVRSKLIQSIETHASRLSQVAQRTVQENGLRYTGIDFSLAPYPEPERSIGTAIEALGAASAGLAGSAAAAAFLVDSLERANFKRAGFCGLFLPVLEDSVLAARAADGNLQLNDLLLYSTLCGTGLDTIPLPGSTSVEAIRALLVDLGAIGLRHLKALTARLMPIPGKQAGDPVHFDFPYFADSGVMSLPEAGLKGHLAGHDLLDIGPRGP